MKFKSAREWHFAIDLARLAEMPSRMTLPTLISLSCLLGSQKSSSLFPGHTYKDKAPISKVNLTLKPLSLARCNLAQQALLCAGQTSRVGGAKPSCTTLPLFMCAGQTGKVGGGKPSLAKQDTTRSSGGFDASLSWAERRQVWVS